MLRTTSRRVPRALSHTPTTLSCRGSRAIATAAAPRGPKREGDIKDSFASLSGIKDKPLPDEFRLLKLSLVEGNEDRITKTWNSVLDQLKAENDIVAAQGSKVIPEIRFDHLEQDLQASKNELKKRGVAVIRGLIPADEARGWKFDLDEYIKKNPQTRGFPQTDPQVWELYWSAAQHRARLHSNLIHAQKTLMQSLWHTTPPPSTTTTPTHPLSLAHPLTYADRLRIRLPGDLAFALGPHIDGGSVERWLPHGYGGRDPHGPYAPVFADGGGAAAFDPWDATARVRAVTDLYGGLGACSATRLFQGWLSLSAAGPREGTLLVNPLLKLATVYTLLRPFFRAVRGRGGEEDRGFLDADNWEFTAGEAMTADLPGAMPGYGMEYPGWGAMHHPHLELDRTMVHVPRVGPGDFVVWHCDTIHAVDKEHKGTGDASVLYIPVCPATEQNAAYIVRMRDAWRAGTPGPDFPGGQGEAAHVGRPDEAFVREVAGGAEGLAAFGLAPLAERDEGAGADEGEREAVRRINKMLGF